jgi:K+-transporting ATPase KdpF subunit
MAIRFCRYEGCSFRRNCRRLFRRQRSLRSVLRKTVGERMESIVVAIIALLLFAYLFVAMIRPEKF